MAISKRITFSRILLWMLCLNCSTAHKIPYSCAKNSDLVGRLKASGEQNLEFFVSSTVHIPLTKGQTFCYDLKAEHGILGDETVQSGRKLLITLVRLIETYEVLDTYSFSIPNIAVKCTCECPSNRNYCTSNYEKMTCAEEYVNGLCLKSYSAGYSSYGCSSSFESANVCCDISVYKQISEPDYRAIHFGKDIYTTYFFEIGFGDDEGKLSEMTEYVQLSTKNIEKSTNMGLFSTVGIPVKQYVLQHKRYFMKYKDKHLLSGEPVNDIHESDIHKLGWYRFDQNGQLVSLNRTGLLGSFKFFTRNCKENDIAWTSEASYYYKIGSIKKAAIHVLPNIHNTTVKIDDRGKYVNINVTSALPIIVRTSINVSASALFKYSNSTMTQFSAEIIVDGSGTAQLLLVLFSATGVFKGSISHTNTTGKPVTIHVASLKPIDSSKILTLPPTYECPTKVCLHTVGFSFHQCIMAPCISERSAKLKHLATIKKFSAEVIQNDSGNSSLHLFLTAVSGTFLVSVEPNNSTMESFSITVTSEIPIDTERILRLSSDYACPSEVCVYTEDQTIRQCIGLSCGDHTTHEPKPPSSFLKHVQESNVITFAGLGSTILVILFFVMSFTNYLRNNGHCCFKKEETRKDEQKPLIPEKQESSFGVVTPNILQISAPSVSSLTSHIYEELNYGRDNSFSSMEEILPGIKIFRERKSIPTKQVTHRAAWVPTEETNSDGYLSPTQVPARLYSSIHNLSLQDGQILETTTTSYNLLRHSQNHQRN